MNFSKSIEAWRTLLGDAYIQTDPKILRTMETATFQTSAIVHAVIRPGNTSELQECLKIANRFLTPLYPISGGMNYGYGSRVPTSPESAVLDLSRMNRILDFDPKQGVLTVEPGVTFHQAFEFLKQNGKQFTLAGTGAPPQASLIGNAVERGLGKGLACSRVENVCNFDVILPTGESFTTGIGRYENAKGQGLSKWAPGPSFDGLFIQSNLGLITKMSFWLTPVSKHFQTFIFAVKDEQKMPQIIEALHQLKQKDILRSSATLFNSYRILGFMGSYPWDLHDGQGPLPEDMAIKAISRHMSVAARWYGDGALYSNSRAQARAERALVKSALRGLVDNLTFFYEPKASMMDFTLQVLRKFMPNLKLPVIDVFFKRSLYAGHLIPKEVTLGSTYFRMKTPVPPPEKMDPNLDKCGTYWLGPIVPFEANHIQRASEIIKRVIAKHGYEPCMTLQLVTARQIDIIASISFDRSIPGEDAKAKACHDELLNVLMEDGYYPYRLGNQSQGLLPATNDDYFRVLEKLKKALDPNDILAPGRYDFRASWPSNVSYKKAS